MTVRESYLLRLLLEFKSLLIPFRHGENFNDPFTNKVLYFRRTKLKYLHVHFKAIPQVDHYGSHLESEPIKRRIRSRNDDRNSLSYRSKEADDRNHHHEISSFKRNEGSDGNSSYNPTSRLSKSYFRTEKF